MAGTKALISLAVSATLVRAFVFAYAKSRFSHDAAQISVYRYLFSLEKIQSNRVCYFNFFDVSLASKEQAILNLFIFTAADFVSSGGHKKSPLESIHHYSADYIFWYFRVIGFIYIVLKIEFCLSQC